jgi:seryl-tRNA synthetase
MTAKEYLTQIRLLDERINDGIEELEQLDSLLKRVTAAMGGEVVSSSKNPDKMADIIDKIIKLRKELNRNVDKYVDIKREAAELLPKIKNPVKYKILHNYYVLDMTFEKIAEEIGYTYQWTHCLHDLALLEFEEILEQNGHVVDRN